MKWKANKTGDNRIITKFAWLPITSYVQDGFQTKETRWLCMVKIHQTYVDLDGWLNDYFVDYQ